MQPVAMFDVFETRGMWDWLEEQTQGQWDRGTRMAKLLMSDHPLQPGRIFVQRDDGTIWYSVTTISFELIEDAMAFRLTWL